MKDPNAIGRTLRPKPPKEVPCVLCGEPSLRAIRIEGKATFIYACGRHKNLAVTMAKKPPRRVNI